VNPGNVGSVRARRVSDAGTPGWARSCAWSTR